MKVKELISILKECDENANVYLSSDSEGNNFGTLTEHSFEHNSDLNFYILYPYEEYLDYSELN